MSKAKALETTGEAYKRGFDDCRTGAYQNIKDFSENIKEFDESGSCIAFYLALYLLNMQAPDYEDTLP